MEKNFLHFHLDELSARSTFDQVTRDQLFENPFFFFFFQLRIYTRTLGVYFVRLVFQTLNFRVSCNTMIVFSLHNFSDE